MNYITTGLFFVSGSALAVVNGGPPGEIIKGLNINKTGSGYFYANGKMQAEINVDVLLSDEYSASDVKSIILKEWNNNLPVDALRNIQDTGWIYLDENNKPVRYNGYSKDVNITNASVSYLNSSKGNKFHKFNLYVSKSEASVVNVCVQVQVETSSGETVSRDTCEGVNNGYINLRSLEPVVWEPNQFSYISEANFDFSGTTGHPNYANSVLTEKFNYGRIVGNVRQGVKFPPIKSVETDGTVITDKLLRPSSSVISNYRVAGLPEGKNLVRSFLVAPTLTEVKSPVYIYTDWGHSISRALWSDWMTLNANYHYPANNASAIFRVVSIEYPIYKDNLRQNKNTYYPSSVNLTGVKPEGRWRTLDDAVCSWEKFYYEDSIDRNNKTVWCFDIDEQSSSAESPFRLVDVENRLNQSSGAREKVEMKITDVFGTVHNTYYHEYYDKIRNTYVRKMGN